MARTRAQARGFTLVELVVTLVVLAILAAIAVPNFRSTIQRSQISSASNALLADLAYARAEAVSRGNDVTLCPSNTDGTGCADGQAYEGGWLVYTYKLGQGVANQDYTGDADKEILLRSTGLRNGVSIQASSALPISFLSQGQLKLGDAGATTVASVAFVVCHRDGNAGIGSSTGSVAGVTLTVGMAGSAATAPVAAASDGSCEATAPATE